MWPSVSDSRPRTSIVLLVVAALSLMTVLANIAFDAGWHMTAPRAALADDDDDGDDDEDGADDGENGDEGEGNSDGGKGKGKDKDKKDNDDPADHDQGQGNDDRGDPPGQSGPVEQVPDYRVAVECTPLHDSRSACMFVGLGDTAVTRIAVPETTVCATLDGGTESPEVNLLSATTGESSYVSDDAGLLLVLSGTVGTDATTTYWVWADDDQLYPATGPALTCNQTVAQVAAPSPQTTGVIVIRAFACDPGVTTGADVDWYAACAQPAARATFSVTTAIDGTPTAGQSGATDDNGHLTVPDLAPGTYQVEQTGGNWCHAESDNVDKDGDVIVEAGIESTIWVFDCQP